VKAQWYAISLICGGACIAPALRAADAAADADLLEYLGSLDSTEEGWHDYLADHGVQEGEAWQRAHAAAHPIPVGARDAAHPTTAPDKVNHP
jgi:hypothetical protein